MVGVRQRIGSHKRWLSRACLLWFASVALGCQAGGATFLTEDDDIRRENLEMRRQAERSAEQIKLLTNQIKSLEQRVENRPRIAGVAATEVPRVTEVRFDRYSGLIDTNNDGVDDAVRIYLLTLDQQGRFMPAIGRVAVQVVAVQAEESVLVIAQQTIEPDPFDQAYRSGITGSHYTLEFPLTASAPDGVKQVTVTLDFTDADTGAVLNCEKLLPVSRVE
jgi:hypothetical protein